MRDSQGPADGGFGPAAAEADKLAALFPQLEILELLGRGGMGVVYKARQRGLDRMVALKLLPPRLDHEAGFRDRFVREARSLARLAHPNIVAVYDFGQVEGRYYFLMEYVDGANLRRMLQSGHLTPPQAMAIVPQLCDALQFAHEEGIVHRDIKPENILIDKKGRVKIADFGLAKLLGEALPQDPYELTGPRQILGTPHYMAPEQLERPATVDHRADIYSLGVVFYEMLTGELPLGRFPPPSRKIQIDVRLDEVVLRTLEKEPEQRFQRVGEVKTHLASFNADTLAWNCPPAPPPPLPAGGRARPAAPVAKSAIVGALLTLVPPLLMLLFGIIEQSRRFEMEDTPAEKFGLVVVFGLGSIFAIASSVQGILATVNIRRSNGALRGLRLALFDALCYPLLVLDGLIVFLAASSRDDGAIAFAVFLVTLLLDAIIFWKVWRSLAHRPPAGRPRQLSSPPGRQYTLQPSHAIGCLATIVIAAVLVLVVGVGVVFVSRRSAAESMRAHQAAMASFGTGYAYPETAGASEAEIGNYRFHIRAPVNCKVILWAELWRSGKQVFEPGFDDALWILPPAGQLFDGVANFELSNSGRPFKAGSPSPFVKTGWRLSSPLGSYVTERQVIDPFAVMPLRDSTWGTGTGQYSVRPGQPILLHALRGSQQELRGSAWGAAPGKPAEAGSADVEVRVFMRFEPADPPSGNRQLTFGKSSLKPDIAPAATRPTTQSVRDSVRDLEPHE